MNNVEVAELILVERVKFSYFFFLPPENEVPLQERKNYKSSPEIQEPIRPLEKRALNFLVNEFLLKNSYKLTSITFSDENHDQVSFVVFFFYM